MGSGVPIGLGGPGLLAGAWDTGAGSGDGPLTIDLDSTICETYGLARRARSATTTLNNVTITRRWALPLERAM